LTAKEAITILSQISGTSHQWHPARIKTSTAQQNKPKNLQNMTRDINYCGVHIFYGRRPDIYCSNILAIMLLLVL
jgi:hypothetical protein